MQRVSGRSFRDYLSDEVMTVPESGMLGGFWDGEPGVDAPRATGFFADGSSGETGDFAGLYWALEGAGGGGSVGHDVVLLWLPSSQTTLIVASNRPELTAPQLSNYLTPALIEGTELAGPVDSVPTEPAVLESVMGTYALPDDSVLNVEATEPGLQVSSQGPLATAWIAPG